MCGIFGYIGKRDNAANIVLEGLKSLEYRGYDSWGIAVLKRGEENGKIIIKKQAGKISNILAPDLPPSNFSFGHTRWATHGGVTDVNAHPHLDCDKRMGIIHNGIVENYAQIKQELLKNGHKFISETDTEVALHLIEDNYHKLKSQKKLSGKRLFIEAVRISFKRFTGLNAIIVMDANSNSFVAVKNGSPLVIGKGKNENFIASDAHALLKYTREVYFLEDDELVYISDSFLDLYNVANGKKLSKKFTHLDWLTTTSDKGIFPHYLLKEIYDQPEVIRKISNINENQVLDFSTLIKKSYGTYLVGCGTAAYACLAGTYIFSKVAKRHINYAVGSEFGYLVDFITKRSLVLALSQSGETIDVIEAVKKAKDKGARIGTLVNVLGSTLYRISDYKLLLGAGVEKAVVTTKAFTAKLAYLILLASALKGELKKVRQELQSSVLATKKLLSSENISIIKKLVDLIYNKEHIYMIGRGISYPIVLEAALKIKEASYIHAEGFAGGELKHGAIALIDQGTPCVVFISNDESYGANLAGAMEMKARGGFIIGVSHKPHEIFDYHLPVSDCGIASIIPFAVVGQLLGYYLALKRGLDPDKPRNLAKSVTVK